MTQSDDASQMTSVICLLALQVTLTPDPSLRGLTSVVVDLNEDMTYTFLADTEGTPYLLTVNFAERGMTGTIIVLLQ